MTDYIRRVIFRPYLPGKGPTFTLTLLSSRWVYSETLYGGRDYLTYRLTMREPGKHPTVLFAGDDYGCSPMHAIDSDASVASLMGFLTLRPGDTDDDYFATYTPAQLDYCETHAEALSCEVYSRFGED